MIAAPQRHPYQLDMTLIARRLQSADAGSISFAWSGWAVMEADGR